jgi:hypothetical protein
MVFMLVARYMIEGASIAETLAWPGFYVSALVTVIIILAVYAVMNDRST